MAEAACSSGKRNAEEMETESGGIDPKTKRPCFPEVTAQKLVSRTILLTVLFLDIRSVQCQLRWFLASSFKPVTKIPRDNQKYSTVLCNP